MGTKRPRKRAPRPDYGPGELRSRHKVVREHRVDEEGRIVKGGRVLTQWPLDRYLARKFISEKQWEAGDKLRRDYQRAGLEPQIVARYSDMVSGGLPLPGSPFYQERRVRAHESFWRALDAVGYAVQGILWFVVCCGNTAGEWAGDHGHSKDAAVPFLRLALDGLRQHYRI